MEFAFFYGGDDKRRFDILHARCVNFSRLEAKWRDSLYKLHSLLACTKLIKRTSSRHLFHFAAASFHPLSIRPLVYWNFLLNSHHRLRAGASFSRIFPHNLSPDAPTALEPSPLPLLANNAVWTKKADSVAIQNRRMFEKMLSMSYHIYSSQAGSFINAITVNAWLSNIASLSWITAEAALSPSPFFPLALF